MTRKQKRKIALITVLLLILALLAGYYLYYRSTQTLTFNIAPTTNESIAPPQFLYSFSGAQGNRMQRPVGVLVDGQEVFVVDSARHTIDVFDERGNPKRSFGTSETLVPLYIAKNPKTGNLYVSDRRSRSIHIFTTAGKAIGEFNPKLPKDELPEFQTAGIQWAPVAMSFAADGTMYVTEILNGHRMLIFDPDGKFVKSVGTAGLVTRSEEGPQVFQFPNGVVVHKNEVFVTDSNNRRVQVFNRDGKFDRIVVTQGLPRGIAFLQRFPGDEAKTPDRYVIVDTLAHDGTIWSTKDTKIVSFGQQGINEGEFSYPNATSVMSKNNKIFITDTANGRVQVWGWPAQASDVPLPTLPRNWWPCLIPFLLLPLLLLLRKKKFFTTEDFVLAMVEFEQAPLMPQRRRKWFVTEPDYEALKGLTQGEVDMAELLNASEYSDSDARALAEKLEIPMDQAQILAIAQRMKVFCTEDLELRRLAKTLEIDVVNRVEFIERFTDKKAGKEGGPLSDDEA